MAPAPGVTGLPRIVTLVPTLADKLPMGANEFTLLARAVTGFQLAWNPVFVCVGTVAERNVTGAYCAASAAVRAVLIELEFSSVPGSCDSVSRVPVTPEPELPPVGVTLPGSVAGYFPVPTAGSVSAVLLYSAYVDVGRFVSPENSIQPTGFT